MRKNSWTCSNEDIHTDVPRQRQDTTIVRLASKRKKPQKQSIFPNWLLGTRKRGGRYGRAFRAFGIMSTSTLSTMDEDSLQGLIARIRTSIGQLRRRLEDATYLSIYRCMMGNQCKAWPGTNGSFDQTLRRDDTRKLRMNRRKA